MTKTITVLIAGAAVAVSGAVAAPADAHYRLAGTSKSCGYVNFAPPGTEPTDYGSYVRAKPAVSCGQARFLSRTVSLNGSQIWPTWLLNQHGHESRWRCQRKVAANGHEGFVMPHGDYRCRDPKHPRRRVVVWTAT